MKTRIVLLCALAFCTFTAQAQAQSVPAASQPPKSAESASPGNASANPPPAKSAIDPAKEKDIRRLLEAAGTKDLMLDLINGMETNIKPILQNSLPPGDYRDKLIDAFLTKFRSKLDVNQLLALAVPLYDQNYSDAEIKSLIAFYETPLGQKVVRVTPSMTAEMMEKGQKLGEELGRASMLEVLAEHPEFEKAMEDAEKDATAPSPKP